MNTVNYSDFRSKLASCMDEVVSDSTPLIVTRGSAKPAVVIMSLKDFKSYEETAYLMSSTNNAKRLNEAIQDIENGNVVKNDMIKE